MIKKDIFIDTCKLLGVYNGQNIYLYCSPKYEKPRIFYNPNYFYVPDFIQDPKNLTFHQAIKIIEYRLKKKESDDFKTENIDIDKVIDSVKNEN